MCLCCCLQTRQYSGKGTSNCANFRSTSPTLVMCSCPLVCACLFRPVAVSNGIDRRQRSWKEHCIHAYPSTSACPVPCACWSHQSMLFVCGSMFALEVCGIASIRPFMCSHIACDPFTVRMKCLRLVPPSETRTTQNRPDELVRCLWSPRHSAEYAEKRWPCTIAASKMGLLSRYLAM